ncbi:hypothetical protein [Kitasatospora purpeofusca]|uniref:hypothetical protein n=1 Tax=Kitasatospora purpeofusca TaxID=67352 RepID=UPI00224D6717|nr:hypothetical protein [Kitasatospora purpeofusca]MCX4755096.1 hypothetical protein [Kitasatospora purpeofusca]WSR29493.1 hypothetical protein OG715_00085 [Kitasatospora purpeofusca]WSR37006.1 hypothetical protein OG715_42265 [Kitasatospora purpeofusca]
MPYLDAVLPSRYMRHGPVWEVEVWLGDPAELANDVLESELPQVVPELYRTCVLSRGAFRIRARVEGPDGEDLAVVEASPERLAPLLLDLACESLATVRWAARQLAGDVQRAGGETGQIVMALRPFLDESQAEALLSAHARADRVTAELAGINPAWGEISVTAHEDGLTRVGLARTYSEACLLASAVSGDPDEREIHAVDHEEIRRSEQESTRLILERLNKSYSVVTADGCPAEPGDLILDAPGGRYSIVHELESGDGTPGPAAPADEEG